MKITIKTLFGCEHPEDTLEDLQDGDWSGKEVWINGELALKLGDDYHDGSYHQVEGFLSAIKYFYPDEKLEIEKVDILDPEFTF